MSTSRQHRLGGIALLALVCVTGQAVIAQCDPVYEDEGPPYYSFECNAPDGSGASYIGDGTYNDPNGNWPNITPDRRPIVWFPMYTGTQTCSPHVNPTAHSYWWRDTETFAETDGLQDHLNMYWDAGFRRIIMQLPGGSVDANMICDTCPNGKYPQAQYWYLNEDQTDALDSMAGWLYAKRYSILTDPAPDPAFEVGVFMGSWQSGSACTPCLRAGAGSGTWNCADDEDVLDFTFNARMFDPTSQSSMAELFQNLDPWINLGFDTIYFDNASNWNLDDNANTLENPDNAYVGPERLLDLMQNPDYSGIKFGGEAIPRDLEDNLPDEVDGDGIKPIDDRYDSGASWFVLYKPAKDWGWFDSNVQTCDPDTTELGICFGNPERAGYEYGIAEVAQARDAGFLIWISHPDAIEFVQRLYDGDYGEMFNAFSGDIVDFDMDGIYTCDDYDTFFSNVALHYDPLHILLADPDLAIWDGDLDNNGWVDDTDISNFLAAWSSTGIVCDS